IVQPLPSAGEDVRDHVLSVMHAIDPYGRFCLRPRASEDVALHLGPNGRDFVVHGSGWHAYLGPNGSPIPPATQANPYGPAFAAVLAGAHLFATNLQALPRSTLLSTWDWSTDSLQPSVAQPHGEDPLGELWLVGAGSVGTAILYFLTLLTRNFRCTLFDMDVVKVHNLDRSPIFLAADVKQRKVAVVKRYLASVGVADLRDEPYALHESDLWRSRQEGTPDLILAAANEHDVRYQIESASPPVQVYGTTGRNWQATVLRHVPFRDACSQCLFPRSEATFAQTMCATESSPDTSAADQVDAALPFLSFAAGLMAAAEVVKLNLPSFPQSPNQTTLSTYGGPRLVSLNTTKALGCVCAERSPTVHRQMIAGTRYEHLSALC